MQIFFKALKEMSAFKTVKRLSEMARRFKNKVREHLEIKNENINRNATDGLYNRIYEGEH